MTTILDIDKSIKKYFLGLIRYASFFRRTNELKNGWTCFSVVYLYEIIGDTFYFSDRKKFEMMMAWIFLTWKMGEFTIIVISQESTRIEEI